MIIGEAPGKNEYLEGKPFVGASGRAQEWYLSRYNLSTSDCYATNVIKQYTVGNPDPTPEQLLHWTPYLIDEIRRVNPKLIIAAGRFAAWWLLGESVDLDIMHGMPYTAGFYDETRRHHAPQSAIIVPIYHPAAGFYRNEPRTLIDFGYRQAAKFLRLLRSGKSVDVPRDEYAGKEIYLDVTGGQLADLISDDRANISEIGLDTETTPSIQVSWSDGTGYVLRACQPDFHIGVRVLQELADSLSVEFVLHDAGTPQGCAYDVVECRKLGLELRHAHQFNTMTGLFKFGFESRSLKTAAERFLRCRMTDYQELIGDIGRQKAVDYLTTANQTKWRLTEPVLEEQGDGTYKLVKPRSPNKIITGILRDVAANKVNKDGPTDPYKRWHKPENKPLRRIVERELGPMPVGNLNDVDPQLATFYASRDADVTRRLKRPIVERLKTENPPDKPNLYSVFEISNAVLPFFESCQSNGIEGSRRKFFDLSEHIQSSMRVIRSEISTRFYSNQPFNPRSPDDVRSLMRRRGLESDSKTPSGDDSTSQDSIGHLIDDEAIGLVFDYRQMATIESNFVGPINEIIEESAPNPVNPDHVRIFTRIKPVTVPHRRISTEKPNILATPSRGELAKKVRACFTVHDPDKYCWVSVDFSGQEMRVAAHVSQDPRLMGVFLHGGDAHRLAASFVYNCPESEVTSKQRRAAKTINFGILYGMAGRGLQAQMRKQGFNLPLKECDRLHRGVLRDAYPGISDAIKRVAAETKRRGVVYDLAGMPRYLPKIWSKDYKEVAEAEREAFSHHVSGTAQAMTQNAMRDLWPKMNNINNEGYRVDPILQFHDELVFLTDRCVAEHWSEVVKHSFINCSGIELSVPIEADAHIGETWADLK